MRMHRVFLCPSAKACFQAEEALKNNEMKFQGFALELPSKVARSKAKGNFLIIYVRIGPSAKACFQAEKALKNNEMIFQGFALELRPKVARSKAKGNFLII